VGTGCPDPGIGHPARRRKDGPGGAKPKAFDDRVFHAAHLCRESAPIAVTPRTHEVKPAQRPKCRTCRGPWRFGVSCSRDSGRYSEWSSSSLLRDCNEGRARARVTAGHLRRCPALPLLRLSSFCHAHTPEPRPVKREHRGQRHPGRCMSPQPTWLQRPLLARVMPRSGAPPGIALQRHRPRPGCPAQWWA